MVLCLGILCFLNSNTHDVNALLFVLLLSVLLSHNTKGKQENICENSTVKEIYYKLKVNINFTCIFVNLNCQFTIVTHNPICLLIHKKLFNHLLNKFLFLFGVRYQ